MQKKIISILILFLLIVGLLFAETTDYSELTEFDFYHYQIDQQNKTVTNNNKWEKIGFLDQEVNQEIMWEVVPVLTDNLELVLLDQDTNTYDYTNTISFDFGFKNDTNEVFSFDSNNTITVTPNGRYREINILLDNSKNKNTYQTGRYFTMFYINAYLVDSAGNPTTTDPVSQTLIEYAVIVSHGNSSGDLIASENTAYLNISPTSDATNINLNDFYDSVAAIKVGTIQLIETRSNSYGGDALDINLIISCSNTEFDDGSIFNFTTDSSTTTLPYKVSISENGNYFDSTFVLTNVGDIMSWQDENRNTQSGNFKSAIIPIYIKSGTLLAGAYLQAGNYTSTIYVNAVDPN